MRKFHLAMMLLVAISAFLTAAVSSASAAEKLLWLVNGTDFNGTLSAETEGDITLVRLASPTNSEILNRILCEGIFDGTVTNEATKESTDLIEQVLNLAMELIGEDTSTSLSGLPIECTVTEDSGTALNSCRAGTTALVFPANLPWETLLELMANGEWLDRLVGPAGKEPGYEVECLESLAFLSGTELCEGNTSAIVFSTLELSGSPGEFTLSTSEEAKCGSEEKVAGLEGRGVTWIIEGELNRLETDVSETLN